MSILEQRHQVLWAFVVVPALAVFLAFRRGFPHFIWSMSEPPAGQDKSAILNAQTIHRVLTRIAHEIVERNDSGQAVVVVGVQRGGIYLAERLGHLLKGIWGHGVPVGRIDVSMHRDDLDQKAA